MLLEELYDHEIDPNEWNNSAYKKQYAKVIEEHRNTLLQLLPELSWEEASPTGYFIDQDGTVRKTNTKSID